MITYLNLLKIIFSKWKFHYLVMARIHNFPKLLINCMMKMAPLSELPMTTQYSAPESLRLSIWMKTKYHWQKITLSKNMFLKIDDEGNQLVMLDRITYHQLNGT